MAAPATQQQAPTTILVEERFFPVPLERAEGPIREALAAAFGAPLDALATGMWVATRPAGRGVTLELTARAMQTEGGTTVEIRVEHRVSPLATALTFVAVLASVVLVVPLFFLIAYGQESTRAQQRERLVLMHKTWTELASALGPPKTQGYRGERDGPRVRVGESAPEPEPEAPPEDEAAERRRGAR